MVGKQLEKLRDALCGAFAEHELTQLVRFELDRSLDGLVNRSAGYEHVVFQLIELVAREGKLGELILKAYERRPTNPELRLFLSESEVLAAKLGHVEGKLDELARLQMEMRYQSDRDLLAMRYRAYGRLWARTKPTKLFTTDSFGPKEVLELGESLSDWYFSETGGLLITKNARDFYFALQDLVQAVGGFGNWMCDARPAKVQELFSKLLSYLDPTDQELNVLGLMREDVKEQASLALKDPGSLDPGKWRKCCGLIPGQLRVILDGATDRTRQEAGAMVYAAIQQVASILRTYLTHELGSRLHVDRPSGR